MKSGALSLLWNASWPRSDTISGSVWTDEQGWKPVAENADTTFPSYLDYEWSSIEANSEAIAILTECSKQTGLPILGRTLHLEKWFRQLAVAEIDKWKCGVFALGGFREDARMLMGRSALAHSA